MKGTVERFKDRLLDATIDFGSEDPRPKVDDVLTVVGLLELVKVKLLKEITPTEEGKEPE